MTAAENLNMTRAAFMRRASAPNVNPFALKSPTSSPTNT